MSKKEAPVPGASNWVGHLLSLQPAAKRRSAFVLLAGALLALLYLIYSILFLGQVYPNVSIGTVKLSGLGEAEVTAQLEKLAATVGEQPVTLVYDDETHLVSTEDADWVLDTEATANRVIGFGRQGPWWQNLLLQISAPFYRYQIEPVVTFDADLLEQKIAEFTDTIDDPAVDASAEFIGGKLIVVPERTGQVVDASAVQRTILRQWSVLTAEQIDLVLKVDIPAVVAASEEELKNQTEQLLQTDLTLDWENGGRKVLSKNEIRSLIGFVGGELIGSGETESQTSSQRRLRAEFTSEQVEKFLAGLADNISRPAKDPRLVIRNGAVVVAEPSREGRVVDHEASIPAVLSALLSGGQQSSAMLTLRTEEPVIHESRLDELGIKEMIARGETNFTGSPVNRRHNIVTGTSFLQSALIAPGAEFSTVKMLGRVDNTTGYLPELVIKENRTIPEYGGGLCQVSTTLFRAAINAGLKITERRNHSYRVSYYEPPIGLDATIYLPKPDFRFLNDTAAHILVQGYVVGNRIVFELWGTSDGRVASTSAPQVFNFIDPPAPIYAETDTLPLGEEKQIEKPHQGATAVVHYTVTRDGQVLNQQTFRSVYRAWPARFLVGTRVDPPPGS
jgi:vancomycin resistance protein YoaR